MTESVEEYLGSPQSMHTITSHKSEDEIAIKENQILVEGEGQNGLADTRSPLWDVRIGLTRTILRHPTASVVKALYDYDAAAPGELTIKEDEKLLVFDREDDWILVQSQREDGRAGFVPGNYVEEYSSEEQEPPSPTSVEPSSSHRVSVYVDPADLVAQTSVKAQVDDIKTWAVSEVDGKGKKKKGTLGIGNGSIFFASEADKVQTPVRQWKTADVEDITVEKQKHLHIDIGGASTAAVIAEGRTDALTPPPRNAETASPSKKNGASVRFTDESPEIIPREPSEAGEEEVAQDEDATEEGGVTGEPVVALYDFQGTTDDELSVQEGEQLWIIEKEYWDYGHFKAMSATSTDAAGAAAKTEDDVRPRIESEERDHGRFDKEALKRLELEHRKALGVRVEEQQRRATAPETTLEVEADKKRREAEASSYRRGSEKATAGSCKACPTERRERAEYSSVRGLVCRLGFYSSSKSIIAAWFRHIASPQTRRVRNPANPSRQMAHHPNPRVLGMIVRGNSVLTRQLLGYSNGKLRLHKVNGVIIEVPSDKMSMEDMRYVEKLISKKSAGAVSRSATRRNTTDDDDQPLSLKRQTEPAKRAATQTKRGPQVDWFEFFLSAGCEIDDCTRYAAAFERDKIDEVILPDITESTMRSLGLREGDIIRVNKAIQQKYKKPLQEQISRDEEFAQKLQEEENGKKSSTPSPASNLFAGPGGLLKNNTQRRGRPQPSKSLPLAAVDMGAIGSASEQIKRTESPLVITRGPTPTAPERQGSTVTPANSGFDDDAWTNRPGAKSSTSATTPSTAPRVPSAPPATQPLATAPSPPVSATDARPQENKGGLAKTDTDIFDQLARLSQLKNERAASSSSPASATAAASPAITLPPSGYGSGLGVGSSQLPLSQHLQNQQSGVYTPQRDTPRGPFAPVPANQSLLHPLIPTTTGFNSFVPTRAASVPAQPSLQPQITGFPGPSQPLVPQLTAFPGSGAIITQPTGASAGAFGTFTLPPSFPSSGSAPISTNPTGLPSLGQSPFNSVMSTSSPATTMPYSQPPNSANLSTTPANIFAQMKSGTFATDNDHSAPQQAGKYDSLRANSK
ncbi:hypothetical protein EDC04DRAFT_2949529 [Pisolithus marmoratus]|nr:hypothetical protein EDC04DRAFT_2949529 [Pisolithus marmoratus]